MATNTEDRAGDAGHASCACGVAGEDGAGERKALRVDAGIKERNLKRLRRIEGQVRGLQRMVEEDRYCADVMTQISSVHEALRSVGRELMRNHLKHCAASAIRSGDGSAAEQMYDELVDLMYKHAR
ncbi:MAG TPA: metal-sensitive transcriptional regulator [Longimicrobiaceae bacterium]|nr:metal-sensitive transcriptional regulator [Longimicrobiaceae bacterium]